MGYSTIVEFNNDFWDEIKRDPKNLIVFLDMAIHSGTTGTICGGKANVRAVVHRTDGQYKKFIRLFAPTPEPREGGE